MTIYSKEILDEINKKQTIDNKIQEVYKPKSVEDALMSIRDYFERTNTEVEPTQLSPSAVLARFRNTEWVDLYSRFRGFLEKLPTIDSRENYDGLYSQVMANQDFIYMLNKINNIVKNREGYERLHRKGTDLLRKLSNTDVMIKDSFSKTADLYALKCWLYSDNESFSYELQDSKTQLSEIVKKLGGEQKLEAVLSTQEYSKLQGLLKTLSI